MKRRKDKKKSITLEWGTISEKKLSWNEAVKHCQSREAGWRMPTKNELKDKWHKEQRVWKNLREPLLRKKTMMTYGFWSFTEHPTMKSLAWYISFDNESERWCDKDFKFYVSCVRERIEKKKRKKRRICDVV